eukprot:6090360-Pyramimonas_sp.AAC.1
MIASSTNKIRTGGSWPFLAPMGALARPRRGLPKRPRDDKPVLGKDSRLPGGPHRKHQDVA